MAYAVTNTYTDATTAEADDVRENHEGLRNFINQGIRLADFSALAVTRDKILRGEYQPITRDHWFETGDVLTSFVDDTKQRRAYASAHIKPLSQSGQTLFVGIDGTAKTFETEFSNALVLYEFWLRPYVVGNTVQDNTGDPTNLYVYVDGVQKAVTRVRLYSPETSAVSSDADGALESRHRVVPGHYLIRGLDAGRHTVELRANPRHEYIWFDARQVQVEVLAL